MTNITDYNQTPQPAEGIVGCVFNGRVVSKSEKEEFESWIATLMKLAEQHEREARAAEQAAAVAATVQREMKAPLEKVQAGPWRSLGGYFDYTHWADRERFMELDRAIAASQDLSEDVV